MTSLVITFPPPMTAEDTAKVFLASIFRHHGLPLTIVSDRDSKFTGTFWKTLMTELGPVLKMSTAFHPQTDGQSENVHRTLEEALRHFVNNYQNDWDKYLYLVEFALNNAVNSTTGYSPFFINTFRHPVIPLDLIRKTNQRPDDPFYNQFLQVNEDVHKAIAQAQANQAKYHNTKYQDITFKQDDLVLISTKNLTLPTDVLSKARKFRAKYCGPFRITEVINPNAYRLDLQTTSTKVHDVFNISRLRKYQPRTKADITPPPPILNEGDDSWYEIERVTAHRYKRKPPAAPRLQFLVQWKGYPQPTWEESGDVTEEAVNEYYLDNKMDPLPLTTP